MRFARRQRRQDRRQFDAKNRATGLAVVTKNFAAVFLQDAEANAEPESRTFTYGLGGVERVEDAMRFLDSRAGVGEEYDDVAAIANGLDGEHAALVRFHGIDGVIDNVEEHLHQLVAIPAHAGKNRFQLQLNARLCRPQVQRTELQGVGDHGIDVQKSAFRRYLTSEAE